MKKCKIEGCLNTSIARGYCRKHYYEQWKEKKLKTKPYRKKKCKIEGCKGKHYARGYCRKHYQQWREGKLETASKEYRKFKNCKVKGCPNVSIIRGYCMKHYEQWRRKELRKRATIFKEKRQKRRLGKIEKVLLKIVKKSSHCSINEAHTQIKKEGIKPPDYLSLGKLLDELVEIELLKFDKKTGLYSLLRVI